MESLNLEKIKIVVFDFDETLYRGGTWTNYYNYAANALVEIGYFKSVDDVFDVINKICDGKGSFGFRVATYCDQKGKDVSIYRKYLGDHIYNFLTDEIEIIDDELLFELSKKYKLLMLSDSPMSHVDFYMNRFGISKEPFSKIYINEFDKGDFTKAGYLEAIVEEYGILPEELLMIGDSGFTDMKSAQKVGTQAFRVMSLDDTKNIIKLLLK